MIAGSPKTRRVLRMTLTAEGLNQLLECVCLGKRLHPAPTKDESDPPEDCNCPLGWLTGIKFPPPIAVCEYVEIGAYQAALFICGFDTGLQIEESKNCDDAFFLLGTRWRERWKESTQAPDVASQPTSD